MQCVFDRIKNVSLANGYNSAVETRKTISVIDTTTFQASMKIYQNNQYQLEASSPFTVTSNQPIYLGISEENKNPNFKFVVQNCWATPSADKFSSVRYMFFHSKCPLDSTYRVVKHDDDHYNFVIDAFAFIQVNLFSVSLFILCF